MARHPLSPQLRAVLGEIVEGGTLVVEEDGTPAVIARLPVTTIKEKPVGFGEIQLSDYEPEGPVVTLIFRVFDEVGATSNDDAHVWFEIFLNPSNAGDRRALEKLAAAPHIHLHVFGAERGIPYIGSKRLTWRDQHRAGAREALRLTQGRTTRWPAAKQRYQREHPGQ